MTQQRVCGAVIALLLIGGTLGVISHKDHQSSARAPAASSSTTSTLPPRDPVVVAVGDIACSEDEDTDFDSPGVCQDPATASIAVAQHPDGALVLGDQQYETGSSKDFSDEYDKSWGKLKAITHPVAGNHEYLGRGNGYYSYFGASAGTPGLGYYSFDLGKWHLIALNSNCAAVSCAGGSAQEEWLQNDLAAHLDECILAYWHEPLFSSGKLHGGNPAVEPFWQDLTAANADMVLNGHEHNYERFAQQTSGGEASDEGIREFVVGTGGRSLYPFREIPQPNSEFRQNHAFGVLTLTLHPKSYDWRYIAIDGSILDSGTTQCHNK